MSQANVCASNDGSIQFEAGSSLERLAARVGHYPESRSENKGNEPEGAEVGVFGGVQYLFIGSERSSIVAVYANGAECPADVDGDGAVDGADLGVVLATWGTRSRGPGDLNGDGAVDAADLAVVIGSWGPCAFEPELVQVLPTGVSPEGLLAIPQRDLLVVASELDARADLIRATISIYERTGEGTYPLIVSADRADGAPIPWAALSGLAVDADDASRLAVVHDSYFVRSRVFLMDASGSPAVIDDEVELADGQGLLASALADLKSNLPGTPAFDPAALVNDDGSVNLDLEGVAARSGGGWWLASEGAGNLVAGASNPLDQPFRSPNILLGVEADGTISTVALPPLELTLNQFRFGFEGVASVVEDGVEVVYVAFQRRWAGAGDPANRARIGRYDATTGDWTFALYPLDTPTSPNGGWVGLSEISHVGDGVFAVIERDNQAGPDARIKLVQSFDLDGVEFMPHGAILPVLAKSMRRDLIAAGDYDAGVILEKLEGMAILPGGRTLIVNDYDGVEDSSGETRLFDLGTLFGRGS